MALGLSLVAETSSAQPNILGTVFNISGSGSTSNCTNPLQNGPIGLPSQDTFTVFKQSGGNFSATESGSGGFFDNYSGSLSSTGNISGQTRGGLSPIGAVDSGTFSGQILIASGNLSITENGVRTFTNGDTCNFSLTRIGTLVSGPVAQGAIVDPARATGTDVADVRKLTSEIHGFTTNLTTRIGDALRGNQLLARSLGNGVQLSGLAAGDAMSIEGLGAWFSYSRTDFENDFASLASEGDRDSFFGGVDYKPDNGKVLGMDMVFGLAFGYENSDIDTRFNRGKLETDGYTIAPYMGVSLNDTWSMDASFGYSSLNNDQFRLDPVSSARINSSPDSSSRFMQGNLNALVPLDKFLLGGTAGILWARSETDRFTESDGTVVGESRSRVVQIHLGGDVSYSYLDHSGNSWEPFVSGTYERDISFAKLRLANGPQPSSDNDNFVLGVGLRFFGANNLTGGIEWRNTLGRNQFDESVFSANMRIDF